MKKIFARAGLAAVLVLSTALVQAQTVTVTGWTFGPNAVNLTAGPETGTTVAGGFDITTDGFSAPYAGSFYAYCVDLYQGFNGVPSGPMDGYQGVAGVADTFTVATGGFDGHAAATSARLSQLMTYALPLVQTSAASTSLQLAIWNVIYDTDNTVSTGSFADNSSYDALANSFLTNSLNTTGTVAINILHSAQRQDFVITPVPEPSTYALMLAGLAGIGFVARRRNQQR